MAHAMTGDRQMLAANLGGGPQGLGKQQQQTRIYRNFQFHLNAPQVIPKTDLCAMSNAKCSSRK